MITDGAFALSPPPAGEENVENVATPNMPGFSSPQCLDFVDFSLILWGIRISNRITQRRQIVPRNRLGMVRYIRVKHKKGKSRRKGRFGMSKYMTKRYRNRKGGGEGECFDPILCMFLLCSL